MTSRLYIGLELDDIILLGGSVIFCLEAAFVNDVITK